jgi:hypothetical protein
MNLVAAVLSSANGSFLARVRDFFVDAWRTHLEVCEIVAESHRRPR